jgi:tryptophanyl-tRNA synthetase
MTKFTPRVFSGMQPTHNLHLGNYLGAMLNWIKMQETHDCIYCVVDMHAITVWQDPKELTQSIREVTAAFIACGIDPKAHIVFNQSQVHEHAELAWIFNCIARIGWLNRMTQFKEKAGKDRENASVGLYAYPCLMAADILAYRATHVPVGEDQKQHLEITRDIAQRFNSLYGETFVMPEVLIPKAGARVKGLDDPTAKMSKSSDKQGHALHLLDPPDVLRRSIMRATTDSENRIAFDPERQPGVANLLTIYQALTDKGEEDILAEFEGQGYGVLKKRTADVVIATLEPIQARYQAMAADPAYIEQVLKDGADRVRPLAEHRLYMAQKNLGLRK